MCNFYVKAKFVFKCYKATKISVYTTERIFSENTCGKFIFFSTNRNTEKRKGIIFFSFKRKLNIFVFHCDHRVDCDHKVAWEDFSISGRESNHHLLETKERLFIKRDNSSLNRNKYSQELFLF